MIANNPAAVCRRVLEQLKSGVVWRELLCGDARADHDRGEERGAEQLSEQPSVQSCGGHGPGGLALVLDGVAIRRRAV
jgi:hypothetical protein